MSSKTAVNLPAWAAGVHAISRAFGVASALLILLSIFVICHMVFVRAVLGASSIWQTEFVTFSVIAATFLGSPYILLTGGQAYGVAGVAERAGRLGKDDGQLGLFHTRLGGVFPVV